MSDLEVYDGEVIWFLSERGFGFISWRKDGIIQTDMFAHFSDIIFEGYKLLKAKQQVTFTIGKNNDGRPKATDIRIVE